ncbi:AAA+ ATPase superfamily predicted ATPase [Allocatelliglobosispora scoriae]|uniref:AAA+ ATPase superfamily predicted ATPase n=1 Tax=Allocatelliglobosispora scoriae TaxID=643052 RepID=A0A841BV80_9ACTN|nr:AAA family ATPase [Allocatelliglobosispora scoriae]MBB5870670.1 AAA+ ATPase superfamily predicted ATPase [Allocatelliglobosispora scoriae]
MSKIFAGRGYQLSQLNALLDDVRRGGEGPGRALLMRGRRRVGKSRLLEVFCERADVPWAFYTATSGEDPQHHRDELFRAVSAESTLPNRAWVADGTASTWDAAFRELAAMLPTDTPSIVVLDELPYMAAADPAFEGALQTAWDRRLSRLPVLLIGVGSDLAMMELLASYGRPFHQRATEMVLPPLNPAEVGSLLSLSPADAFDAHLITGGLPLICQEWPDRAPLLDYLSAAFTRPTSALLVSGERSLASELPPTAQAPQVLAAIGGGGERTFTTIGTRAGVSATVLSRALELLMEKHLVTVDTPLSMKSGVKDKRYRIADPYLRFWLAIGIDALPRVDRGRPDLALRLFKQRWLGWRGRAIEPIIHDALARLLPDDAWPDVNEIGGWWPRSNIPELDIVGADRAPVADRILFVGSIKWRDQGAFTAADLAALATNATAVPGTGAATQLVAVSRNGVDADVTGLAQCWTADDLIAAWQVG